MKTPMIITIWAIIASLNTISGVPLSRVAGCGEPGNLPSFKANICCQKFGLHCPTERNSNHPAEKASVEKAFPTHPKVLSKGVRIFIRNLGERCSASSDRCAVGLHCHSGRCARTPSPRHLRMLLERGRLVEKEEKALSSVKGNVEDGPLADGESVTVQGQSIQVVDTTDVHSEYSKPNPRRTPTPIKWSERKVQAFQSDDVEVLDTEPAAGAKALMEEEDELADNISDLLSSKMGVSLDNAEKHSIREVIAGTLDERTQREDQIADNDEPAEENREADCRKANGGKRCAHAAFKSNFSETYSQSSFFEPFSLLVQCASDSESQRRARKSTPDPLVAGKESAHVNVNM